jgi:ATP-dependent DNA helicase RecG
MMTTDEIRALLNDLESDRVERTISTTNTDKFGQAICAFANDLPDHRQPGCLFLGVDDDGVVKGVNVTDELLKNVAAIRTDGNIQPQPSMTVEKVPMPEGDIVMVRVEPSVFPPVRYKGRIWIRIGSRKGVANEDDERILMEKRRVNVTAFDASPCLNATIDDMDLQKFKHYYLPKAMTDDEIDEDRKEGRTIKDQMSSFGFFDTKYDCPTNAGMLFFAKNLRRFIPGAYIQYVRFAGKDRAGEIMMEHEFKSNLCTTLQELDTFVETTIANRRPIPVSSTREDPFVDYPYWATRELLMNAICHRDYTSNGPIQFYQYDDRIEIMNHGGLYGRANEQNFPKVNDYRNIVVAEAMKVLGFVNRHSRGVLRVQKDLKANENGEAVYDFSYQTAVMVTEKNSPRGERATAEAIANGFLTEEDLQKRSDLTIFEGKPSEKPSNLTESDEGKQPHLSTFDEKQPKKQPNLSISDFPTMVTWNVYQAIKLNRKAKYSWLADNLGVSERTIQRAIDDLKKLRYIDPEHSKVKGEWQLLK